MTATTFDLFIFCHYYVMPNRNSDFVLKLYNVLFNRYLLYASSMRKCTELNCKSCEEFNSITLQSRISQIVGNTNRKRRKFRGNFIVWECIKCRSS